MLEKINQLAIEKKDISDFHLRGGSDIAYRELGEIVTIPESKITDEDLNALLKKNCTEEEIQRFEADKEFDTGIMLADLRFRANFYKTLNGTGAVLRRVETEAPKMDKLNLPPVLYQLLDAHQGLVLVTGPTGSGKTTTLYSILKEVSKPHLNILTAEDPVEYELDGVGQVQIKDDIGYDFGRALRSFLRQDPEIILVGEMRDKETVDIGLKAALTGHLVFSTLHTNDAPSSITRLQNMGTPDYLISAAVSLILAQRLARKTCSDCREPDADVTPQVLEELGFSPEQASRAQASNGKGCSKCKDSGYKGRMGIYEILNVTKPIKEAILAKATTPELKAIAVEEGFRTMQDMGRELILSGDLNFREFDRVLGMD